MFSTCFEPEGSSLGRRFYIQLWYGTLYMHQYRQFSRYKSVFNIKITIIPQHTSSYLFWAILANHQGAHNCTKQLPNISCM